MLLIAAISGAIAAALVRRRPRWLAHMLPVTPRLAPRSNSRTGVPGPAIARPPANLKEMTR